ncbi:hypothetical protein B0H14DRAFT_2640632 [Mycena olivaceomarginata]|nr:hypothetical protein B0H14DRAFT_2640632 [Mycena olivaceomarginata]
MFSEFSLGIRRHSTNCGPSGAFVGGVAVALSRSTHPTLWAARSQAVSAIVFPAVFEAVETCGGGRAKDSAPTLISVGWALRVVDIGNVLRVDLRRNTDYSLKLQLNGPAHARQFELLQIVGSSSGYAVVRFGLASPVPEPIRCAKICGRKQRSGCTGLGVPMEAGVRVYALLMSKLGLGKWIRGAVLPMITTVANTDLPMAVEKAGGRGCGAVATTEAASPGGHKSKSF